jgi:hypothetical protein
VANAITKEQFIELHVRIKYAICRGQKYTDTVGVNTVSFDTVLELYNAGKAKPTKRTKKTEKEKTEWSRVQAVRTTMLRKADAMYRRWMAKLFPVEALGVRSDDQEGGVVDAEIVAGVVDDAVSVSGAADGIAGDETGSQSDEETPAGGHQRPVNKRAVVPTKWFFPEAKEHLARRAPKRGRAEQQSTSGSSKRSALEKEVIDEVDESPINPQPPLFIIFIDQDGEANAEPSQVFEDVVIRISKRQAGVVDMTELGDYVKHFKWN